ncbi:MAG: oligosaccharide flippase family protein [Patescibacteria group bacterium]|jgi:O-antigen/teichoic acid export membrane protein
MNTKIPDIKRKGLLGIAYFLGNSTYSAILGLVANLVFTIFLQPSEYGLYFIVLSIMTIFNYFTDVGLAASLIQHKNPGDNEYHTAFTIQIGLVTTIVAIGAALTPVIGTFYHFSVSGITLYIAMLISLFLLSLKSIPSARLERELEYSKIVATQAIESTLFYVVSIVFLLAGFKIYALAIAVIIRSIAGMTLIYGLTKWRPRLYFDKVHAKAILSFGIPFQSNVLLAFVKDDLLNLYMANVLGLSGIGYVGWAKKWAEAPLRIIIDNLNKVLFPVFSKMQDDKEKLAHSLEKIIFYNCLLLFPVLVGAYFMMPLFVAIIPKYQKWTTALPSFSFFLISSLLVSFTTPAINMFNAIGKVRISVKFMILWIILNWTMVPLSIHFFGLVGVSIAFALNATSFVLVIWQLKRNIPFQFIKSVFKPAVATVIMAVILTIIQRFDFSYYMKSVVLFGAGAISYSAAIMFMTKGSFINEIWALIKKK